MFYVNFLDPDDGGIIQGSMHKSYGEAVKYISKGYNDISFIVSVKMNQYTELYIDPKNGKLSVLPCEEFFRKGEVER